MSEKVAETALVPAQADMQVALRGATSLWASATTSEGERRADLLRDKQRIVLNFFRDTGRLMRGVVKDVLTNSPHHPHGIKVRLETGEVGRVEKIITR